MALLFCSGDISDVGSRQCQRLGYDLLVVAAVVVDSAVVRLEPGRGEKEKESEKIEES